MRKDARTERRTADKLRVRVTQEIQELRRSMEVRR